MSFLCVIVITGCKELISFSSCISLLFRPATIIFMAKITFSLSLPKFREVRKQSIFPDNTTGFLRNDVWGSTTEIPYWWRVTVQIWIVTRHQYGISELLLQPSFPGETNGSVWKCRPFCHATSFWGWLQSEPKPFTGSKLSLKFWIISFWVTAHLPLPYANILP